MNEECRIQSKMKRSERGGGRVGRMRRRGGGGGEIEWKCEVEMERDHSRTQVIIQKHKIQIGNVNKIKHGGCRGQQKKTRSFKHLYTSILL